MINNTSRDENRKATIITKTLSTLFLFLSIFLVLYFFFSSWVCPSFNSVCLLHFPAICRHTFLQILIFLSCWSRIFFCGIVKGLLNYKSVSYSSGRLRTNYLFLLNLNILLSFTIHKMLNIVQKSKKVQLKKTDFCNTVHDQAWWHTRWAGYGFCHCTQTHRSVHSLLLQLMLFLIIIYIKRHIKYSFRNIITKNSIYIYVL